MELANQIIFVGALLIVLSIVASAFSSRFGVPILLVFLLLGMLAGEDGPGGIRFDDFQLAYLVGTIALAVILFDGGMRTRAESFRVGLRPALVLSTAGVVITAVMTGVFAAWVFGTLALALGAATGSRAVAIGGASGAAVVFYVLWGLAPLIGALEFSNSFNPWYWVMAGDPIIHGIQGGNLLLLAGVTGALVAGAVWGLRRRDLGV